MREIKFRAWDSVNKKMLVADEIRLNNPNGNSHIWVKKRGWIDAGKGYLMQYMGLKDKNGKEVYGDDIIKDDIGHYLNATVVKMDRFFWHDFVEYGLSGDLIEVIGNIYENPELKGG